MESNNDCKFCVPFWYSLWFLFAMTKIIWFLLMIQNFSLRKHDFMFSSFSTSFTIFFICDSVFCQFQGQFLSFQVFFKHFFSVFWNMNRAYDTNFFGFAFWSLISLHMCEPNILYHQTCTWKVDFMFFVVLQWYFWCLRHIFCWIFQEWNLCISKENSPNLFLWGWYLYCVVSNKCFVIIFLDDITILFLGVCRFLRDVHNIYDWVLPKSLNISCQKNCK